MPLQIRRGTDAERLAMTQPLAQGELLFVSTPGAERLYIGNGSTLGGIQITGYTNADAKDAAAASFTGGTHSGITFTYNTTTDLISATVDLSNYQGSLRADAFKGSVFADDSTLLVDAVSGTISGTSITGNIFTNLIDSENSSAITFTPSVIFNSDVTVENQLFASLVGNVTGNVIGNIQGNVTDTSGIGIVDVSNRTFNGAGINLEANGSITSPGAIFTDTPFFVFTVAQPTGTLAPVSLLVANTSGSQTASFGLARSRGSIATPATVINNDEIGKLAGIGFDGVSYISSSTITTVVDGAVSSGVVPSRIEVSTTNSSGTSAIRVNIKSSVAEFSVPPKLPVVADDTARTALVPTPSTGMMIFMSSGTTPAATNKVQVYDSAAWVNLH